MVKGFYAYIKDLWKNPTRELVHERMIQWRAGNSIVKVDKPLRLDKARALGYKAKKGIIVARVRLIRGGRTRPKHTHGRKSGKQHVRKTLKMNARWVAEQRAGRYFNNLEVLNSYQIGKDGKYYFFEVILVDPQMPEMKSDKELNWIISSKHTKRAQRGLTSAGRKSRGLRNRGPNFKVRPSMRAWNRSGK